MPELVPLARLKPAPWNPRSIRDERFKNLVRSIKADPDFLRLRPVLASLDGTIYAGNMRYRAAEHLKQETVWAEIEDVPEKLAKERAVRDNQQWGEWEDDQLGQLLAGLQDVGSELDLLGFEHAEIDRLLESVGAGGQELNPDNADLTLPAEPITKPGNLWLLGEHRLLCGDATKAEDVARLLGGKSVDVVLTDPPYGIDLDTDFSTIRGSLRSIGATHGTQGNTYDPVIGDDAPYDPAPLFQSFGRVDEMFLFGAEYYAERIPNRDKGSWLVWDKRKESQAEAIGSEFELIWSKRRHKRRMLRHDWFGFLSSDNGSEARDRQHPTQKPTSLLRDILDQWAPSDARVGDLYAGSGSTLIACEQTARVCYAMEIEPAYVDVAVRRWEHVTGKQARRG